MDTVFSLLLPVCGYLFGAIPFGLMIGRMAGVDVRLEGSKNIGATNVSRLTSKKLGLLTLACDCLKGYLPMLFTMLLLSDDYKYKELIIALSGVMAVLGHMFSIYLGFKGGKGVATGLGVFFFLSPAAIAVSFVIFAVAVAVSGFVSVGSLMASALLPLWLWFFGTSWIGIGAGVLVSALIWFKHNENISRLLKGEEKSWRKSQASSAEQEKENV